MHDHTKLEEGVLRFWESNKIYEQVKESLKGKPPYYFCDGPPYATGQIHSGTAWNKVIKDAFCRYKRACGYSVRAQPGFDTHGLPIEVKVEKELKISDKHQIEELGVDLFVSKCKDFATQYIGIITEQFKRCGVWMDWETPYITYKDRYIESSWKTIKTAHEKGLLHEGAYVVPYCSRCQTTLANYELEYGEQEDPSIYVKFRSLARKDEYFIIWTTTPWTLVSNMAIMAHPIHTYTKAKVGDEVWIVAKERLEHVLSLTGKTAVVVGEISGKKLENTAYEHPLQESVKKAYERKVVLSDEFVTLSDGTGLVHCAPGHGPEDFIIGRRFGIEVFSPIDSKGRFTKEAGIFAGMHAREASAKVIEKLKEKGCLLHEGKVAHRYPHCWRCKTPLIFIATNQWFISISKLKSKMLSEIEACEWQPAFAKSRFIDFVSTAPDWCISRQRYWGIPLPIWKCAKCGHMKVVGSADELPKVKELHRPYIDGVLLKCEKCGFDSKRISDILDVWFDSGNAVWASLEPHEAGAYTKADLIVEGKDQIRGWFYSLLGSGVVLNGEIPYRKLLMHGFFVDEKGEKMSKSLGNFVPLEDILEKHGADAFRLWSLSNTAWDDLRFNWEEIREASRAIRTIYNLGVFLNRFCSFHSKPQLPAENLMHLEDEWLLSRLANTIEECTSAFESCTPHIAAKSIRSFLIEDVSRTYMKLVKERIGEDGAECPSAAVLYHAIFESMKLLSPIAPFISEHVYRSFYAKYEKESSISMFSWPKCEMKAKDALLERHFQIALKIAAACASARQKAAIPLRWPLEEVLVESESTEVLSSIGRLSRVVEMLANVRRITIAKAPNAEVKITINKSKVGEAYKRDSPAVIAELQKADKGAIAKWLAKGGEGTFKVGEFEISREMVSLEESAEGYSIAYFDEGKVFLKTKINRELYEQAMTREVARRIQLMRKEEHLVESDRIVVFFRTEDEELLGIIKNNEGALKKQVNALSVEYSIPPAAKSREWEIGESSKAEISIDVVRGNA